MRNGGDIFDDADLQADGLNGAHGGFAAGAGALDAHLDFLQAVAHRLAAGILGNHLCRIRGTLARAFEAALAGAGPADDMAAISVMLTMVLLNEASTWATPEWTFLLPLALTILICSMTELGSRERFSSFFGSGAADAASFFLPLALGALAGASAGAGAAAAGASAAGAAGSASAMGAAAMGAGAAAASGVATAASLVSGASALGALGFFGSGIRLRGYLPALASLARWTPTVLRGPLRVRALVEVRWPRTGRLRRWRMPR